MGGIDKRDVLGEDVFRYTAAKDGKVFIRWHGRPVTTLSGGKARAFLAAIQGAEREQAQLIMAKATGNFKRGNEKQNRH